MSGVDPNWEVRHWPTASRGWWLARAGADAREPEAPTWLRGLVGEWAGWTVVVGGAGGVVPDRLLDSLAGLLRRLPPRRAGSTRIVCGAGLTDAQQQRVRAMAAGSPGLQVSFAPDVRLEPGGLVAPHGWVQVRGSAERFAGPMQPAPQWTHPTAPLAVAVHCGLWVGPQDWTGRTGFTFDLLRWEMVSRLQVSVDRPTVVVEPGTPAATVDAAIKAFPAQLRPKVRVALLAGVEAS